MKFAIRRADTTNYAIYRKRYAHVMKSCFARLREADLISFEAKRRRFHPNLFGFHRAEHDFIKKLSYFTSILGRSRWMRSFAFVKFMDIR